MRRLPVYLLLDTSGSMNGEPIEAVKNGIQVLVSSLTQDPYALETAYLSVITFDSSAKQVTQLTELSSFQPPSISASGGTSLGDGLSLLASKIESEVVKTTFDRKGDWKPLIFIMTDGDPTDNWKNGLTDLKNVNTGMIIACAAGPHANTSILKQITEIVIQLDNTDSATISAFFKWVSASISTGSQKLESGKKEADGLDDLPPPPKEINIVV